MDIERIRELVVPYLEEHNLLLYSLKTKKEYGMTIVEVLIDSEELLDIDTLALCNTYLCEQLDQIDQDWPEYYLEVSSAGAEKELKSLEEVKKYINSYVNLETTNDVLEGKLEEVNDTILHVKVNLKGRMKIYKIDYQEIKKIRLAVHL